MERLFLKFLTHSGMDSDDYYESVEPILYSSQEEALKDFNFILKEYEVYLQDYLKKSQELCLIRDTFSRQIIALNEKGTLTTDSVLLEAQKNHKEAFDNCTQHVQERKHRQLNLIDFGGYDLDLDVFFTPGLHSNPTILTIKEYFENVEKKIAQKKQKSYIR